MTPADLSGKKIGVPGEFTTSYMLLRIFVDVPYTPVFLDFDAVGPAVDDGTVDAGILLHEGQILYEQQGYNMMLDLGVEWFSSTGLPATALSYSPSTNFPPSCRGKHPVSLGTG